MSDISLDYMCVNHDENLSTDYFRANKPCTKSDWAEAQNRALCQYFESNFKGSDQYLEAQEGWWQYLPHLGEDLSENWVGSPNGQENARENAQNGKKYVRGPWYLDEILWNCGGRKQELARGELNKTGMQTFKILPEIRQICQKKDILKTSLCHSSLGEQDLIGCDPQKLSRDENYFSYRPDISVFEAGILTAFNQQTIVNPVQLPNLKRFTCFNSDISSFDQTSNTKFTVLERSQIVSEGTTRGILLYFCPKNNKPFDMLLEIVPIRGSGEQSKRIHFTNLDFKDQECRSRHYRGYEQVKVILNNLDVQLQDQRYDGLEDSIGAELQFTLEPLYVPNIFRYIVTGLIITLCLVPGPLAVCIYNCRQKRAVKERQKLREKRKEENKKKLDKIRAQRANQKLMDTPQKQPESIREYKVPNDNPTSCLKPPVTKIKMEKFKTEVNHQRRGSDLMSPSKLEKSIGDKCSVESINSIQLDFNESIDIEDQEGQISKIQTNEFAELTKNMYSEIYFFPYAELEFRGSMPRTLHFFGCKSIKYDWKPLSPTKDNNISQLFKNIFNFYTTKKKLNALVAFGGFSLFVFDQFSDINYVINTQFNRQWMKYSSQFIVIFPFLHYFVNSLWKFQTGNYAIALYLSEILHHKHVIKSLKNIETKEKLLNLIFVLIEDIPQIWLQTENNMLIGRSLTWLELITPLTGMISVAIHLNRSYYTFIVNDNGGKFDCKTVVLFFFMQGIMVMIALRISYVTSNEKAHEDLPEWAKEFKYFDFGLGFNESLKDLEFIEDIECLKDFENKQDLEALLEKYTSKNAIVSTIAQIKSDFNFCERKNIDLNEIQGIQCLETIADQFVKVQTGECQAESIELEQGKSLLSCAQKCREMKYCNFFQYKPIDDQTGECHIKMTNILCPEGFDESQSSFYANFDISEGLDALWKVFRSKEQIIRLVESQDKDNECMTRAYSLESIDKIQCLRDWNNFESLEQLWQEYFNVNQMQDFISILKTDYADYCNRENISLESMHGIECLKDFYDNIKTAVQRQTGKFKGYIQISQDIQAKSQQCSLANEQHLGDFTSLYECSRICYEKQGCQFFMYKEEEQEGRKGKCTFQPTSSPTCSETGLTQSGSKNYKFYANINGGPYDLEQQDLWYWYRTQENIQQAILKANSAICSTDKLEIVNVNGIECTPTKGHQLIAERKECEYSNSIGYELTVAECAQECILDEDCSYFQSDLSDGECLLTNATGRNGQGCGGLYSSSYYNFYQISENLGNTSLQLIWSSFESLEQIITAIDTTDIVESQSCLKQNYNLQEIEGVDCLMRWHFAEELTELWDYYATVSQLKKEISKVKQWCERGTNTSLSQEIVGLDCIKNVQEQFVVLKQNAFCKAPQYDFGKFKPWDVFGSFIVEPEPMDWFAAREACKLRGDNWDLVSIADQSKLNMLKEWALQHEISLVWIGLHDTTQESSWQWSNGRPLQYTSWAENEPNNARDCEDCASFDLETGTWNDLNCKNQLHFVCERNQEYTNDDQVLFTQCDENLVGEYDDEDYDPCSYYHDERPGATSEERCLALEGCLYFPPEDHCYSDFQDNFRRLQEQDFQEEEYTQEIGGMTAWPEGSGWCKSSLNEYVANFENAEQCWIACVENYGDEIVAIDLYSGECYCQNDCQCMSSQGDSSITLLTRDSFEQLPYGCDQNDEEQSGDYNEDFYDYGPDYYCEYYDLEYSDQENDFNDALLYEVKTLEECSYFCKEMQGCQYFRFGTDQNGNNECMWAQTDEVTCPEGFFSIESQDFYSNVQNNPTEDELWRQFYTIENMIQFRDILIEQGYCL